MSPADMLSELSIKIYEPPLSALRDDGTICDLSNPIAVVMLVIDFETEVSMNGINNFIGNFTGRYAAETVAALRKIGCAADAERLQRILDIVAAAGMTHDAIQQERSVITESTVTSFSKMHGDKWDSASEEIKRIESEIDYSDITAHAERFVADHAETFRDALGC
jgi:hypothetical protein